MKGLWCRPPLLPVTEKLCLRVCANLKKEGFFFLPRAQGGSSEQLLELWQRHGNGGDLSEVRSSR